MLNFSASRCKPSFANARTICSILTTAAQDATLARSASDRISLESARSALHDDVTSYSWISWWSLRRNSYRNDHAHLRCNHHLDSRHYCARARQWHIANIMWNLTFHFIRFCRSKITRIQMLISHYFSWASNRTNAWLQTCIESGAKIRKKKLSLKRENWPYLMHFYILHVYALLQLQHYKVFLCTPNMKPP